MIQSGFFTKSAADRLLQLLNSTIDRLIHSALLMRREDRLAAIAARLDHAAFVVMTGLVTDRVAEVHIVIAAASRCRKKAADCSAAVYKLPFLSFLNSGRRRCPRSRRERGSRHHRDHHNLGARYGAHEERIRMNRAAHR
jgi:hypothetical protein